MLADGVPYIATGWFAGGYTGEYAGWPLTVGSAVIPSAMSHPGHNRFVGISMRHVVVCLAVDSQA